MRFKLLPLALQDSQSIVRDVETKIPRLHALDAMRGVFSVFILLGHFCLTLPTRAIHQFFPIAMMTPLRWGYAFVILFFMLSGFVLALPYAGPCSPDYRTFLIRRMSRLYIPFAAITLLTFLLYVLTGTTPETINAVSYRDPKLLIPSHFTLGLLAGSLIVSGLRQHELINLATWSLVYEVRIALFFPLLVALCRRPLLAIAFMAVCYAFVFWAKNAIGNYFVFPALTDDEFSTWLTTIYIVPCIMFGIMLALYGERVHSFLANQPAFVRAILWILVFVNFSFLPDFQIPQPFTEFASVLLILLVLSSDMIGDISEHPVLQWLGRISYSTYLVHLPILFALRGLWEGKVPLVWLFAACFVLTFPIATLTQRFIERPARQFARNWVARLSDANAGRS